MLAILEKRRPDLLEQVEEAVVQRLATGRHKGSLVNDATPKDVAKYALIMIRQINPLEELSDPETALLRGISTDTLEREKAAEKQAVLNAKANYPQHTRR
jgi:hypothetical protein